MPTIFSPAISPACFAGLSPSIKEVTTTPSLEYSPSAMGLNKAINKAKNKNPATILANGPAPYTANCFLVEALTSFFSSGSTNAPGINGIIAPITSKPEFLTGNPNALAITPCEPSCITNIIKIQSIQ